MPVVNIETFQCSTCHNRIPDKDLESLVKVRVEEGSLQIICPKCIEQGINDEEVNERRQSMVVMTTVKGE